jgi:hypothetical protein
MNGLGEKLTGHTNQLARWPLSWAHHTITHPLGNASIGPCGALYPRLHVVEVHQQLMLFVQVGIHHATFGSPKFLNAFFSLETMGSPSM